MLTFQVKASMGGTTSNHLKEWLRNQKWPNHFPEPFTLIFFATINYKISHDYQLQALIYNLNFILEFKN
jgi:hypothetical protein